MKVLIERTEIAEAINFGKYPVLSIDLADKDDCGLKGCKIRIDAGTFRDGSPHIIAADLRVFRDSKKLTTSRGCTCLSDSFTYYDLKEMVDNAQAPIIKPGQEVVISVYDSKNNTALCPMIVRVSDRVDKFCSSPIEFEYVDMSGFLKLAGFTEEDKND